MKHTLLLLAVSLTVCASVSRAQSPAAAGAIPKATPGPDSVEAKVDKLFAAWDKPDSPGAAVAVVRDGVVIYKRGYGIANLEYGIPITPATVFHVASVSKQFTAFSIMLLAKQGKLSVDDDIRKHLPEVPDFGKTITIQHLLHHTSGLRDQWELLAMAGWRLDDVITKEHILKMVRHEKELNFEPGAEMLYCNTGYTLLAVIVERVSGQSFRQYTQDNIFKPLGMTNTHFHDDHEMIVKNRAYSYAPQKDGYKLSALNYANVGATSLFTTVEDLARWIHNFDNGDVGGMGVIEQMYQPGSLTSGKKLTYAAGLSVETYRGLRAISHGGGDAGYRTYDLWFPDQKLGVAVLSNLATFNPGKLAEQVADIYLPDKLGPDDSKKAPVERKFVSVSAAVLDAYVGEYALDQGPTVEITKEDGHLMARSAGGPKTELFPESNTRFYVKPLDAVVEFNEPANGKATQFTLHQGDQHTPAKRISSRPTTEADLAEYTGDYYSEELGTTYTVTLQSGALVVTHRRHDDITLKAMGVDNFQGNRWFFQRVRFTRDNGNRVSGFRLTGSRVRNVRFDKRVG
jgi:CubicO group peptidase (beta-lactamase class C family)